MFILIIGITLIRHGQCLPPKERTPDRDPRFSGNGESRLMLLNLSVHFNCSEYLGLLLMI